MKKTNLSKAKRDLSLTTSAPLMAFRTTFDVLISKCTFPVPDLGGTGLRAALETLAASSLTDGGDNVLAAEVLWTPEEPWETLTREDAISDFPELLDI